MPESIFILRFVRHDLTGIEEQQYNHAKDAWDAFRLLAEPDSADIYARIELVEYNRIEGLEYPLARLDFLT